MIRIDMFSIYELYNQTIPASSDISLSLSSGGINFDASDARGLMYTIKAPSWNTGNGLDLIFSGSSSWSITIPISSTNTSGYLPVPPQVSWMSINITLLNNTLAIANNVDFVIGISRTDEDPRGTTLTTQSGIVTNSTVYAVSKNNTYPLSLKSANDGSLITVSSIPDNIATLSEFSNIASITGYKYFNAGNINGTNGSFNRSVILPSISAGQHCALVTTLAPEYPTTTEEYVIDITTPTDCQIKFGSLSFLISQTSIDIGFLKPQGYHSFTVTSATGIAGTLTVNVYGITITGAVTAAGTRNIQANNIADLINNNKQTMVRAVAFADRVYIRTLMNQLTAGNTVTTLYTVTNTPLVTNTGETDTSVKISSNTIDQRREVYTNATYRMWVRPGMVSCYRQTGSNYPAWSCVGNVENILQPRGCDGDLTVFNSAMYGTTSQKQINQVSMYAKTVSPYVFGTYEITRSIAAFAVTTMIGFINPLPTTSIYLKSFTVENTTANPISIKLYRDARLPTTNATVGFIGTNGFAATSATTAGNVIAGTPITTYFLDAGVVRVTIGYRIAPFSVYAIVIDNDPLATPKTGGVGISMIFEESA